ncbi:PQQ-like beta-propeller repeat protein [Sphingomicrobium clamense]|uniref:PQQ-like beta-propeller repeat protein n=1 Tax=Sphingomicrobium clamense TaxID=2851013 RepID=A0ABS6V4U3_9SPHN|nr:PQQ-like beta-propeller repeat protein [Sphingomicrobium sp. B8]MBW0144380.1 PQQ-like beta-propeller repeat protein [Sphingomicrobium sp. B8]
MTMTLRTLLVAAVAATALSGCGLIKKSTKTTPVLGDRIAVLNAESEIGIDATTATLPLALPAPSVNAEWGQSGGNAQKSMGHPALASNLSLAWSRSIGEGSSESARLTSSPIITGGKVYTIDTQAVVRSFDAATGAPGWSTSVTGTNDGEVVDRNALYGGGVASGAGRIYASNGLGYVYALDPTNGGILWQVKPLGPIRGAPSYANGNVYVMTQDNQVAALDAATGATQWTAAAAMEIAGVFGAASPAVGRGTVIAGFSSGELAAYRYENGRGVWQDTLTRTRISTSVSSLSDIDADPVIDNNQVIAIGQGGRMVALDILSGQRMWELNIAGMSTPWVAGEWVFVVTDDAQALAISRTTGRIRWINQLPRWENEKKKKDPIFYEGPVLASGRLVFVGSNGAMVEIDADTGSYITQRSVGDSVTLQPVIANQTLYLITDSGQLQAYR